MYKRILALLVVLSLGKATTAQKTTTDSLAYYDDLFSELDSFLDSILAPRTLFLVNTGITSNFFNYTSANGTIETKRRLTFSPSVGYYHKGGLGLNVAAMVLKEDQGLTAYQGLVTGSYDYLKADRFITGVSFTKFFTKEALAFYTSPLQNEVGAYFTYRKWWAKPSITARYGWGTRTAVEERQERIRLLRLRPNGFTRVSTKETVSDFSVAASLRHDFYWLDVLGERSVLRFTPQITFTSGTQKFGMNETSNTYGRTPGTNNPVLFKSEDNYLDDELYFQPLSLAAFLKTELSFRKFFLQPQIGLNYYFPATNKHFTTAFLVNTGFIF
ncbi:MAG: hypothetical protein JWP69_734 [Flaviaesturariibacter sp.]|nr:hypothetical protein [Flaviaesturariibacter sp.]